MIPRIFIKYFVFVFFLVLLVGSLGQLSEIKNKVPSTQETNVGVEQNTEAVARIIEYYTARERETAESFFRARQASIIYLVLRGKQDLRLMMTYRKKTGI